MKIEEITNKLGIKLNDMQEASAQAIIGGNADLAVLSPTGSGKTLAYLLPVSQLIDELQDEVQAIVIVPGRELALQTTNVLQNMGTGIRSFAAYGGRPTMDEHRVLRRAALHFRLAIIALDMRILTRKCVNPILT